MVDELPGWLVEEAKHLADGRVNLSPCCVFATGAECDMTACVPWILDGTVCLLPFSDFCSIKAETAVYTLIVRMMEQT